MNVPTSVLVFDQTTLTTENAIVHIIYEGEPPPPIDQMIFVDLAKDGSLAEVVSYSPNFQLTNTGELSRTSNGQCVLQIQGISTENKPFSDNMTTTDLLRDYLQRNDILRSFILGDSVALPTVDLETVALTAPTTATTEHAAGGVTPSALNFKGITAGKPKPPSSPYRLSITAENVFDTEINSRTVLQSDIEPVQ